MHSKITTRTFGYSLGCGMTSNWEKDHKNVADINRFEVATFCLIDRYDNETATVVANNNECANIYVRLHTWHAFVGGIL